MEYRGDVSIVDGTLLIDGREVVGKYTLIRDEKSSTTNGGTFTSGAWRTRDLNTKPVDEIGVTLSSNQFTLPAGTYDIVARAPAYFINTHKARLRNITDGTTVDEGTSEKSNDDSTFSETSQESVIRTRFTINESKTFEIQHQCQTTGSTNGFGIATTFSTDNEIYTTVEIIGGKLAPRTPVEYAHFRDEKSALVAGGTFTSGAWRTRDLNTVVADEIGITLSSNQFTLPAGTYRFSGKAMARLVNGHAARLQNITDATTVLRGGNVLDATGGVGSAYMAHVDGKFTITASKTFELQHRCITTRATDGFGSTLNFGNEIFASIELEKES